MNMTLEEAKRKILEKVLSLKTGWRQEACEISMSSSRIVYSNQELAELILEDDGKTVWIKTIPEKQTVISDRHIGDSKPLAKHIIAILADLTTQERKKQESRIIQIAQSL
jgi:hypothetical protein